MTKPHRPRPAGIAWSQVIPPGTTIQLTAPNGKAGRPRTVETQLILDWLRGRPPTSSHVIHDAVIRAIRPLWTPGRTASRLSVLATHGWIRRLPGGLFQLSETSP